MIALQFSLLSYTLLFSSTLILSRPLQFSNNLTPIFVTLSGIVILVKPLHPANAIPPISVTLSGIVIPVRPLRPINAPSPISVTPDGTFVFLQPAINVLLDVSMIALQFSLLSYTLLFSSTLILSRPLQPLNASTLISVTLSGIVILVRPLQPANAYNPISVTLSGIVILVRPLQPTNAIPPISVTPSLTMTFTFPCISLIASEFVPSYTIVTIFSGSSVTSGVAVAGISVFSGAEDTLGSLLASGG